MGFVDDPEPCGWLHGPIGFHGRIATQRSVFVNDNFHLGHHVCDDLLCGLDLGGDTVDGDDLGLVGGLGGLHYADTITGNVCMVKDVMKKEWK